MIAVNTHCLHVDYAVARKAGGLILMKTTIMLFCLLFSANALAQSATTKGGYFACLTEEWFNDIMKFVAAGDTGSADAYRKANKCLILKSGLQITVTDRTWTGRVEFVYQGVKFWTVKEAIRM